MKKKEAEQLLIILTHEKFLATKCKPDTYMALVRNQITIEPIREEIEKARKVAREKYATEELKELEKQAQQEGATEQVRKEYLALMPKFMENVTEALKPILDAPADITIEKLSPAQFEQVIAANEEWIDLNTITFLYKHIVDASKTEA